MAWWDDLYGVAASIGTAITSSVNNLVTQAQSSYNSARSLAGQAVGNTAGSVSSSLNSASRTATSATGQGMRDLANSLTQAAQPIIQPVTNVLTAARDLTGVNITDLSWLVNSNTSQIRTWIDQVKNLIMGGAQKSLTDISTDLNEQIGGIQKDLTDQANALSLDLGALERTLSQEIGGVPGAVGQALGDLLVSPLESLAQETRNLLMGIVGLPELLAGWLSEEILSLLSGAVLGLGQKAALKRSEVESVLIR